MTEDSLVPRLTALDRRVLEALPVAPCRGVRVRRVLADRPELRSDDPREDVRGILRGLEAVGMAQGRSGWWKRPAEGTIAVHADHEQQEAIMSIERGQVPEAQAGGMAEGEDVGAVPGAPEELREEDVTRADALDDRVAEEELPGDDE